MEYNCGVKLDLSPEALNYMVATIVFIFSLLCLVPLVIAAKKVISWKAAITTTTILLFLFFFGYYWVGQYCNILWFDSVGLSQVFWTAFGIKWSAFIVAFIATFLIYAINILVVSRSGKRNTHTLTTISFIAAAVLSLVQAIVMYSQWNTVLLNNNAVPFGVTDPIFNKDIGFYVFNLDFQFLIANMALETCIFAAIITFLGYAVTDPDRGHKKKAVNLNTHILLLATALIGIIVWERILCQYTYLFSSSGVVAGAGYTDIQSISLNWIFIVICAIAGIIMLMAIFVKSKFVAAGPVILVPVSFLILLVIIPSCIQSFYVKPNEFQVEEKYITYDIKATRDAYKLNEFQEKEMVVAPLTKEIVDANQPSLNNVRVWDWRAIADTYNQLQLFRTYYAFNDIDVDRYMVNGQYRQVLLAAREIDQTKLNEKTWINQHFVYTHGYGLTMNTANDSTSKSEPIFIVGDVPPKSTASELSVKRPEIYFGKFTTDFAITGAQMDEFNYPEGDKNNQSRYAGSGGISLDSFAKRLAFAINLDDLNILISGQISDQSKILWNRNIRQRIKKITPYLTLDTDDYIVLRNDGGLTWLQDAYTTSNRYPYSARSPYSNNINYIRNSVKIAMDAYNGNVDYYVYDNTDPVIKAYSKAFPSLFKTRQDMPKDLVSHVRYPEVMFLNQVAVYTEYHMTNPKVFYNKEDTWEVSKELFLSSEQYVVPYFVIASLPDSTAKDEFILMMPFTPKGRSNMIAWIGARCDESNYGETIVYKFTKQQLVYGTLQVEAKINQKDEMASQFTLWSKSSSIIRGNTLVIPIGNAIIYTQPVYLISAQAKMPQIVRVIAGSMADDNGNIDLKLEWGGTFKDALNKIMPSVAPVQAAIPNPNIVTPGVQNGSDTPGILNKLIQLRSEIDSLIKQLQETK